MVRTTNTNSITTLKKRVRYSSETSGGAMVVIVLMQVQRKNSSTKLPIMPSWTLGLCL